MVTRITPWRDQEEWLLVKASFYPSDRLSDDSQRFAVDRVKAWSARGRVPHAVVSTSMLTTAMIRDRTLTLSTLESRMMLSMAIVRFVNGLLDPAQRAAFAISMNALAKTIGLPESFVEIRHSATHDALPALPALRSALLQALDWLWQNYWNLSPQPPRQHAKVQDHTEVSAKLDMLLRSWRKIRKSEPNRPLKSGDADPITKQSLLLLKDLSSSKDIPTYMQLLAERLLQPKNLLSAGANSTAIWTPFLGHAIKAFRCLRNAILLRGIAILASDAPMEHLDIDLDLIGHQAIAPDRESIGIPNIEGSFERLQDWLFQVIEDGGENDLDVPAISRALCLAKDQYTLQIMHKLRSIPAFANINRLIKLRSGQLLTHEDESSAIEEKKPETYTLPVIATDDETLVVIRSGAWTKIRPSQCQPIGWLVT